jgi:hypothetical protein
METQRIIAELGTFADWNIELEGYKKLIETVPKIFKCLNQFATCEKEQNLILRVEYVYLRGFRQLSKMSELIP